MGWPGQCRRACARQGFMSARNLLTDIAGVSVGHADDAALASGVTAILFDKPAVASVAGRGGQAWLAERGRGFRIRDAVIPIVTGAICFDLLNGGNKQWGRFSPYRDLGYAAANAAGSGEFALGSVGAGL